jgi:hypothetical protein
MSVIDLADPVQRAEAIRTGLVWSGPAGAQELACQEIASGAVPMPSYVPPEAQARISELGGPDIRGAGNMVNEGGPA